MKLNSAQKIHFIGIGGIGMSGLARLLVAQGKTITGSDLSASIIIEGLKREGLEIFIGEHQVKNLSENIDLIIRSSAVREDNPEVLRAKEIGITVLTYPEVLGEYSQNKFSIAISGMHGKTTTTAMVGELLEKAGLDPTVLVGSLIKKWSGNARVGQSKYFVFEADEYDRAFLNYRPNIIILTRVEEDHLDTYKNLSDIIETFVKYVKKLPAEGVLMANSDDKNIDKILNKVTPGKIITYGLKSGSYQASVISEEVDLTNFKVSVDKDNSSRKLEQINFVLKVPGQHNVCNALAAIVLGQELKIKPEIIKESLAEFSGTWRRFEEIGEYRGVKVISDYAHHPTEVKATLEAAQAKFPHNRLVLAYQPHQHNRTKNLFSDFIGAFDEADLIIMNEIFDVAGREESEDQNVSSRDLVEEIKKRGKDIFYSPNLKETQKMIKEKIKSGDVLIIMGAGNIYEVGERLVRN